VGGVGERAGVDVGREHHWVVVFDAAGRTVLSRKVANDERDILPSDISIT
jgi:hypothetical protein